jgi:hypothetical protein
MIEIRNAVSGGPRDLLIFEVYIPSLKCLQINVKLRANKLNKPYVVFPCMVEEREDGTKRYHRFVQFDQEIEDALKKEVIPRLRNLEPEIFSQFD